MAKKTTTVHEQESDLNLKREAFCRYCIKNQALFGNGPRSYAEAFGWNPYPRAAGEGGPPSQKLSFRLQSGFEILARFLNGHFGEPGTRFSGGLLALQLSFLQISESMGNHDSKIVDADSVD